MHWTNEELLNKLEENPSLKIITGARINKEAPKSRSKYHSTITKYNGVTYHSEKEASFAMELDDRIERGEIDFWLRQVPFQLAGGIIYKADFVTFNLIAIEEIGGKPIRSGLWGITIYEVKGYWTQEAKLKLRLFREKYPNLILEVV